MFSFIKAFLLKLVYWVRDWLDPAAKERAAAYERGKAEFDAKLKETERTASQIDKAQEKLDAEQQSVGEKLAANERKIGDADTELAKEQSELEKKLEKIRNADDDDVLHSNF